MRDVGVIVRVGPVSGKTDTDTAGCSQYRERFVSGLSLDYVETNVYVGTITQAVPKWRQRSSGTCSSSP